MGYGFRFQLIGILSSLRTTQFALDKHDRRLSDDHRAVIGEWVKNTPQSTPEVAFMRWARNKILKDGEFPGQAHASADHYELTYQSDEGETGDLLAKIRWAMAWWEHQLADLETKVPTVEAPP